MLKRSVVALLIVGLPSFALAQEPRVQTEGRPASADGTVPLTDRPDGPAKTALPEQDASPKGTGQNPGSAASETADKIK